MENRHIWLTKGFRARVTRNHSVIWDAPSLSKGADRICGEVGLQQWN